MCKCFCRYLALPHKFFTLFVFSLLHVELPENWTDTRETLLEGMTFNLRHLGMTLVDQPKGEEISAAAVKRIVATILYPPSFSLIDCCPVVFPQAQAVSLTVAQAFRVAFEFWEVAKEEREHRVKWDSAGETSNSSQSERSVSLTSLKGGAAATENLLDINDYSSAVENVDNSTEPNNNNNTTLWEMDDGLEEAFSRLAESRTNPQVLDIGVMPQDWNSETEWDKTNGNAPNASEHR
ncbi:Low density lipoprotein receptor adapter protein 1-B [Anabarilius grahami]|uniref:Low density lipoprotein receptor adapter protein 1-B n=1 Tax=Anabarilius grahami TaxID=495550 RepID=A0A3N0XZ74_ANAGA|nr:Low density lipoprotein receptor adapter protein 1-B [Anabarilius grahami]